jgi:hypothetical protein
MHAEGYGTIQKKNGCRNSNVRAQLDEGRSRRNNEVIQ